MHVLIVTGMPFFEAKFRKERGTKRNRERERERKRERERREREKERGTGNEILGR